MKQNILPVVAAVAALSILPFTVLHAQQDENVEFIDFSDEPLRVVGQACYFEQGAISDLFEDADDYRAVAALLRDAELPVRRYVEDSLANSEDAMAMALRDFSAWYTHRVREQNLDEMTNRQIGELIGKALELGLQFVLPGSGIVVTKIRSVGGMAYQQVLQNTPAGDTDPAPYIERVAGQMADSEARIRVFSQALFNDIENQPLMDQIEAIKFEYVMEQQAAVRAGSSAMTRLTPGSCTGQMLNDIGIQRPTTENFARLRHAIIENLMEEVLCDEFSRPPQSSIMNCSTGGRSTLRAVADSYALRIMVVGRANVATMGELTKKEHLDIVCPHMSSLAEFRDCEAYDRRTR